MEEQSVSHPVEKEERRMRNRSRPNYSDRRRAIRYEASFPAQIIVGKGKDEKVYQATVTDISDGGLYIDSADVPTTEERFKIKFRVPDGSMPEEYIHGHIETEVEVRRLSLDKGMGVQFKEPLSKTLARKSWSAFKFGSTAFLVLSFLLILFIKYNNLYFFWFDVPVFFYSLLVGSYLLSRFLFASFYRPAKAPDELPALSVVVPAHNEEHHIERTIQQLMESDYPADKLQVIVVDDGSDDGTLSSIQEARKKYPGTIVITYEQARGKRQALAAGFRLATGDFIAFTDSDSFVKPDALRQIMGRFMDPEVAAVTGHCDVENIWTNMLTKMQAVRYYISFRVIKAAESVFGCVTCLSGPLAVYRRERLEEVFEEWLNQKFLGRETTFGDDRALTNALLRRHYKVVYESSAKLTTMVPENWKTFMNQQLRWKRSWFRESLIACKFMWQKEPLMSLSFYLGFLLPMLAPIVVLRALIYTPIFEQMPPITYISGVLVMSIMLSSTYMFVKRSRLWIYGIHFCFFYMFVLVWQVPWAVITCAKNEWGTRTSEELREI